MKKLLCLALLGLACTSWAQDQQIATAQIESIEGNPKVRVINVKTSNQRFCEKGAQVDVSDKIVTENGQSVVLQMAEGTEISIGPSTSFQIDQFTKDGPQQSIFSMAYGMMRALVTKKYGDDETFAVRTKNSVMGVRGTEFVLQSDAISNETQVHTFSGTVRFAQATNDLKVLRTALAVPAGSMSRLGRGMQTPLPAQKFDAEKFRSYLKTRSPSMERRMRAFHPELNRLQSLRPGTRVPHVNSASGREVIQRQTLEKKRAQITERRQRWERRNARFGIHPGLNAPNGQTMGGMQPGVVSGPAGAPMGGAGTGNSLPPPPPPPGGTAPAPGSGSGTLPPPPPPPH